jgi:hypothetical protein
MSLIKALDKIDRNDFIPAYSGKRSLDSKKLLESPINDKLKEELKKIFAQTKYFSWDDTIKKLGKSIDQALKATKDNFYLPFKSKKFNSELLFIAYFWKKLKNRVVDILPLEDVPKNSHVLFIDDFVLTGGSIGGGVDEFEDDTKRKDLKYSCAVVACSEAGYSELKNFRIEVFSQDSFPEGVMAGAELGFLCNVGGENEQQLSDYEYQLYPFFSDHKISNVMVNLPKLFHYGRIGDLEIGCLIGYPPDEFIKKIIWEKYFKDLVGAPKIFAYDI